MAINWDDLRYLLAVVETGSLTAAARQLGSSQPTIGRRIKALETDLDVKLLRRVQDKYELTPLGETIFNRVRNVENVVFDIERLASGAGQKPSGRVRIATTECIASSWLVRQLPELASHFPDLDIEILTGIGIADLMRKDADIAIRVGVSGPEKLESNRVGIVEFGLYAHDDYLQQYGTPTTIDDLAAHVGFESLHDLSGLPQNIKFRRIMSADAPYAFDSILTQRAALSEGLGIMVLPKYLCHGLKNVRRLIPSEFSVRRDLWLLTHPDLLSAPRFNVTWRYLRDALRSDADVFANVA